MQFQMHKVATLHHQQHLKTLVAAQSVNLHLYVLAEETQMCPFSPYSYCFRNGQMQTTEEHISVLSSQCLITQGNNYLGY